MSLQCFSLYVVVLLVNTLHSLGQKLPLCKPVYEGKENGLPCALFSIKTGEGTCRILKHYDGVISSNSTTASKCTVVSNKYMECTCRDACHKTVQENLKSWKPENYYHQICRKSVLEYLEKNDLGRTSRSMSNQVTKKIIKVEKGQKKLRGETIQLAGLAVEKFRKKRSSNTSTSFAEGSKSTKSAPTYLNTTAISTRSSTATTKLVTVSTATFATSTLPSFIYSQFSGTTATTSSRMPFTSNKAIPKGSKKIVTTGERTGDNVVRTTATTSSRMPFTTKKPITKGSKKIVTTGGRTRDNVGTTTAKASSKVSLTSKKVITKGSKKIVTTGGRTRDYVGTTTAKASSKMSSTSSKAITKDNEEMITVDDKTDDSTDGAGEDFDANILAYQKTEQARKKLRKFAGLCLLIVSGCMTFILITQLAIVEVMRYLHRRSCATPQQKKHMKKNHNILNGQPKQQAREVQAKGTKPGLINKPVANTNPSAELMQRKNGNTFENLQQPSSAVLKALNKLETVNDETTADLNNQNLRRQQLLPKAERNDVMTGTSLPGTMV